MLIALSRQKKLYFKEEMTKGDIDLPFVQYLSAFVSGYFALGIICIPFAFNQIRHRPIEFTSGDIIYIVLSMLFAICCCLAIRSARNWNKTSYIIEIKDGKLLRMIGKRCYELNINSISHIELRHVFRNKTSKITCALINVGNSRHAFCTKKPKEFFATLGQWVDIKDILR